MKPILLKWRFSEPVEGEQHEYEPRGKALEKMMQVMRSEMTGSA